MKKNLFQHWKAGLPSIKPEGDDYSCFPTVFTAMNSKEWLKPKE